MIDSFKFAFNGIWVALKEEKNVRIHFIAMAIAVIMGIVFGISLVEWTIQLLLFGMVIGGELFNTSLERITDAQYPDYHSNAKFIKDVAAGAVLFVSIIAMIIGGIIYIPKILALCITS